MNFGLGLVLSFTDNATAGINNAVNSLNNLSESAGNALSSLDQMASLRSLSVVANEIGNAFVEAGGTIITSLSQVIGKINEVGSTYFYAQKKLGKLYATAGMTEEDMMNAGAGKLSQIAEYAQNSIFQYEDLIDVVSMLKANGIEAFDSIASSSGNANQTLMDYAADLAAFNPQMRNAYGTGIQAAMGALNEYIAEGNARSLKSGASLDITGILGEDKGATIEERSRQVADLLEKLGLVGMTASMQGTPMQRLSNIEDLFFNLMTKIANGGVFDKYTELVSILADGLDRLNDATKISINGMSVFDALIPAISDTLVALIQPIETILEKVIDLGTSIATFLAENPAVLKMTTIAVAIGGALLVLAGIFLKFTSAMSGVALFMQTFGMSFSSLGTLIRTGSLKILGTLIPLTMAISLLAMAWKTDFAGIKTNVTYYTTGISTSFKTAKDAVNGSVSDMIKTLQSLRSKGDFFSNLTIGIMKLMIFFRALRDGWNDYTLSEDTFLKAKELGILPLIEAVLDLKYRFDFFKQGFIDGWREIGDKVKTVVDNLLNSLDGTFLGDIIDRFTSFLQIFSGSDTQAWYDFGKSFAEYTAKAVAMFAVFGTAKKIISTISGITTVLKPLLGLVMAHPVVAIIVGVVTALAVLYAKSEKFRDLVSSVIETIKSVVFGFLSEAMPLIYSVIGQIKSFLPQIQKALGRIFTAVGGIFEKLVSFGVQVLPIIAQVVGSIINTVISLMPTIMNVITTVMNILATVYEVLSQLFDLVLPFLLDIWSQLGALISDVLPVIADLISVVVDVVMNLVNTLLPIIQQIIQALMPIIKTIFNIVSAIVAKLVPVIKSLVSIVSNIIKAVIAIIVPIITVVMQIVEAIIVHLAPIVDVVLQIVGFIIDLVLGIVQIVVSVIESIVAVITGIIEVIMSILNAIVQGIMVVVGNIVGIVQVVIETIVSIISAIVGVVQGIWDAICNTFSNAVSFFSGVFTSVSQVISNVFNGIASFFNTVWNKVVTTFSTLGDTISGAIKGAINTVVGGAVNIINGFIKAINSAIGVINAIPGVSITKLTELSVPALAQGGVVDKPTTALIGEAGTEAVVPLENNTDWLSKLASMITTEMAEIRPTSNLTNTTTNNGGDTNNKYMTSNNNTTQTVSGDTDNSINFNAGAIQITANNSSDEEAERMAKKIMQYIKRQQELDRMTSYA